MSGKGIDITGQRFGKLVALKPVPRGDGQGVRWQLQCDCGKIHEARANVLRLGNVKSCGCARGSTKPKRKSLSSGDRFGQLTVIERNGFSGGKTHYTCRCDCGAETSCRGADLTAGNTKSCGCLRSKN